MTVCSVLLALTGFAWYAIAASCSGGLPASGAVRGWTEVAGSTRSGAMGSKASYDAFDGAVDAMKAKGIRFFAQRMYKGTGASRYVTVDVQQLGTAAQARALYAQKKTGYKSAKPLTETTTVKDRAIIGTLGSFSFGIGTRGVYVFEVTMTKAKTAADRDTIKAFLKSISGKLGA